ncbi:T9SS type A sorting domain-containing protein [Aurantibacillus circumpalustris]|uniref:T9SS type A sorting domain-containing protein n=1 Tax=Aurantibacillus circumpalustris TaxID=3036359 RepID=UPI00295C0BA4|nr:T9SS type A sorting domain-containing protein [Aurantibacillus circumpalustris]
MTALYKSLKIKTTVLFLFISSVIVAQNFSPFNANVTKRFYNSATATDNSYFFYADSSHHPAPGKTIFYQYFTSKQPASAVSATNCGFWGGGAMLIADTTWLGAQIIYDSLSQHLLLKNYVGDTLDFDFSIQLGDSAKFYENNTDKYFIKATQTQNETIYSVNDTVKTFTILHFNSLNQVVNSALQGKQIKLSKETGLISFIDTYHFPGVEKHFVLQGQLNPLIGIYQMRFEDLYPFQPGDSLQYFGSNSMACYYVWSYRIVSRQETADSVTITFNKSIFNTGNAPLNACLVVDAYPNTLTFQKNSDIIGFPYNRLDHKSYPLAKLGSYGEGFETRTEGYSTTNCGNRLVYMGKALAARYCSSCACIGNSDAYNMTLPTKYYANGIGMYYMNVATFKNMGQSNSYLSLGYSSIGGNVCGTYYAVGLPKYELSDFSVYPNPAKDELTISAPIDEISIISADGTTVQSIFQPASTIAIGHLPPGLYILKLRKGDSIAYTKIIKL